MILEFSILINIELNSIHSIVSIKDNIKEKILLVNLAKQFGEVPDPKIVAEIDRYNSIQEKLKSSIRSNFSRDFGTAARKVQIIEDTKASYPKPPSLSDIVQLELVDDILPLIETKAVIYPTQPSLEELTEFFTSLPVEEVVEEIVEIEPEVIPEKIDTLVDIASKFISDRADDNVEEALDPTKLEIKALTQKIKYLEQWMSRVAVTSGGGGEVRVLRMDDVNASTVGNGKYMKYDAATQKIVFDTPTGSGGSEVGATISETAPLDPISGKLWYNTSDGVLYIYVEVNAVGQWVGM